MTEVITQETLREWASESGKAELEAEVKRLTKIVRKQSQEVRRLNNAYAKLKSDRRTSHEWLTLCEQLQEVIERLEKRLSAYEGGSLAQSANSTKRSREALGIRYGRVYVALRELTAGTISSDEAAQALADADDKRWVKGRLRSTVDAESTEPAR